MIVTIETENSYIVTYDYLDEDAGKDCKKLYQGKTEQELINCILTEAKIEVYYKIADIDALTNFLSYDYDIEIDVVHLSDLEVED